MLKRVQHRRLPLIGHVQLQIVVDLHADVVVSLHVAVHALDHVMTGGAERHQLLSGGVRRGQRADGGKARCDLVRRLRIDRAAALPFRQLAKLEAKRLSGLAAADLSARSCRAAATMSRLLTSI